MKLEAFSQDERTKIHYNEFIQSDNSITKHVRYSATKYSNLDVLLFQRNSVDMQLTPLMIDILCQIVMLLA